MKKLKVLSLFDGISCGQQALTELGYELNYYASEIEKEAIQVTQKNFPETKQLGDIKKLNFKEKEFDLIIGGSTCQSFSNSGNRLGL